MRRILDPLAVPLIRFAARSYIAGEDAADAARLARQAQANGFSCTLCYWNDGKEEPERVAGQYRQAIDAIQGAALDGVLAIKTPALWDRADLAASLVRYARERRIRVVFDSHAPAQTDDIFRAIDICGPEGVGLALPGRWRRSRTDAERAIRDGLSVRIVKGQWPDEPESGIGLRDGYLELAAQLAGRACHVGVATHDAELAEAALRCLKPAGTPCEQELIYPDPTTQAVKVSDALDVPSRLYIPFGSAWLPYSLSRAAQKPEVLLWLLRDVLTPNRFKMPPKRRSQLETAGRMDAKQ